MIILLNGAAGSGKTHFGNILRDEYSIPQIKSYTSKPKEESDYDDYIRSKEQPNLIERTEINGHIYGTPLSETEKIYENRLVYKIVDKEGVDFFKEKFNARVITFSLPLSVLVSRLENRGMSKAKAHEVIIEEKENIEHPSPDLTIRKPLSGHYLFEIALGLFGFVYKDHEVRRIKKKFWDFSNYLKGSKCYSADQTFEAWRKSISVMSGREDIWLE